MTRRIFLSDVHLEDTGERFAVFDHLLQRFSHQVDEVYLLGDICEIWIGDDDDAPLIDALAVSCNKAATHATLFFMPGNRDFLVGDDFAHRAGLTRLPDPYQLDDKTLLSHGDALCTDDAAYQQLRALMREPAWQADMLAKPLAERRAFGQALRDRSQAENANKASNIMDVNPVAIQNLLAEYDSSALVHGHTHRPGVHTLNAAPGGTPTRRVTRFVLGAWERCAWWLFQDTAQAAASSGAGGFQLHCQAINQLALATRTGS